MRTAFDMELFLAGMLTGSHATRQRHLRQAKVIQAEIAKRCIGKRLGLGKGSTWSGLLIIIYTTAANLRSITTLLLCGCLLAEWKNLGFSFANHQPGRFTRQLLADYPCIYHDALLKAF